MIEIRNLSNFILNNINLSIKKGDLFVLLGPNGAGKTTLLNVIAGFYDYTGTITINDKSIEKVPIEKRHIGYVFQDLFLFPHLTVYENIAFGLKVQKKKYKKTVEELLNLLNLRELSYRYPSHLSGGEKQKVALARVLAINPKIILMDEPFSNLDPTTAKYLRDELKQIQKSTGITTLYVTHDQSDAKALADRIAVLHQGHIEQVDSPENVFYQPKTPFVAKFVGCANILNVRLLQLNEMAKFRIICPGLKKNLEIRVKKYPIFDRKKELSLCLHPEKIKLCQQPKEINSFLGHVLTDC